MAGQTHTQGRLATEWDPRISPAQSTASTLAPWVLTYNDNGTSADYGKLASVTRTHNSANGSGTAKTVVAYSVPLTTAAGGPANMDTNTVAAWGQNDAPVSAVAIFPPDHAPSSLPPSDWTYAQIDYYDANGREVNTASYNNGWNITTTEYDQYGNDIRGLTAANRATALATGSTSASVAAQLDTQNLYSADSTELTDTYGPAHQALAAGAIQTIRSHTHDVYDQGAPNGDKDANGNPYQLVTSETASASIGTTLPGSSDVDGRTTQNVYNNGSDNTGWTLHTPLQTVTDPGTSHLNITKTVAYNEDSALYGGEPLQISSSQPSDTAGTNAGTTKTIYYTSGSNKADSACGNQPAWTDLVCKTEPAAQPGTQGMAGLPVTTYTYDVYLQPLTKIETYTASDGTTSTRTTTTTYSAGRITKHTVTTTGSGMGSAVPPTKTVYDLNTGLVTNSQALDAGGAVTADLNTSYDDWGQNSTYTYTDAAGQTTRYTYDLAGRRTSRGDTVETTTLTYNGGDDHSGDLTSESDTLAGDFSAAYDQDGSLLKEAYPGGTSAAYSYNSEGTAIGLTYTNANWSGQLTDTLTTNAFGDWTSRAVLGSSQTFGYDSADHLTSVADTQSGQCSQRSYSYDSDSNRLSETDSPPADGGNCQSAEQSTTTSSYDSGDRLTGTGYGYDTQGNLTAAPGTANNGGSLTASYYANGMLAGQNQSGASMTWTLDPSGSRAAAFTDSATGVTWTNHYTDGTDRATATTGSDGSWVRNLVGPNSLLAATVTATGTTLELTNLHGDVMATETPGADDSGPTATFTYSEFGAAETGTPGIYGWLGGDLRSSATLGEAVLMGARAYSTGSGRFDQMDPGTADHITGTYDYVAQNPLNHDDLSGASRHFQVHFSDWHMHVRVRFDKYYSERVVDAYWIAMAIAGVVAAAIPVLGQMMALLILDMTWNWWVEEGWIEQGKCLQYDTGFWGHTGLKAYRGSFCR